MAFALGGPKAIESLNVDLEERSPAKSVMLYAELTRGGCEIIEILATALWGIM